MVTQQTIAGRLERFEAVAGLKYDSLAIDIWYEKYKGLEEKDFITSCNNVENKIKWHILPTLNDFIKAGEMQWRNL